MAEERKPKKRATEAELEEMSKAFRAKLKKYYGKQPSLEVRLLLSGSYDDDAEDASLLALAEERMKNYDPSKVITQAEIDAEFGFEKK